jgi:hypothetical protein
MKKTLITLFCVGAMLTGCSQKNESTENVHLNVKQGDYPILAWHADGSHLKDEKGTLTLGNKPVKDAVIQVGERFVTTDGKGQFSYNVEQSKFSKKIIQISVLEKATIEGKKLTAKQKEEIKQAKNAFNVYYPVKVLSEKEENGKTVVSATFVTENHSDFPTVRTGKHALLGTVRDADGNPIKGAIVSTTKENGEGWAKSKPTDKEGHYLIPYLPESDEDATFRVTVGDRQYTLPDGRVYYFPEDTSSEIDVTLPRTGTVINDKPPTLISKKVPGSMKPGTILGADGLSPDEYSVTVAGDDGHFTLTLPTEVWKKNPTFFEKKVEEFYPGDLTVKDAIPKEWLKEKNPKEPDGIVMEK